MREMPIHRSQEHGFTLIELIISMAIGVILLAGISMMFVSDGNMATAQSNRSERFNDLYLASQIMQSELRQSSAICWDSTNNRIIYQPLDSSTSLGSCDTVNSHNGSFEFQASNSDICWDKPDNGSGCQELIRNLSTTPQGLQVSPTSNADLSTVRTVTLTSLYVNAQKQDQTVDLAFHVWPRN
jgi:prepilin-type N-terminal cleavage/methylation domain-containing protein